MSCLIATSRKYVKEKEFSTPTFSLKEISAARAQDRPKKLQIKSGPNLVNPITIFFRKCIWATQATRQMLAAQSACEQEN
jgi:hypothetical protein